MILPEVFVYPTESFFALGASATNQSAIRLVRRLKGRSDSKPIALIASSARQVEKFFVMRRAERALAKKFWPGSLTILLKPRKHIRARALGAPRIGVRVPAHAAARRLAQIAAAPITATSANLSGRPPTKSRRKIRRMLPGVMVAAGRCGHQKKPSTIIRYDGQHLKVLRQGAVHV